MKKLFPIIAGACLMIMSCSKEQTVNLVVSGEYSFLTPNSVDLTGWVIQEQAGQPFVYGIEYSDTDLNTAATAVQPSYIDESSNMFLCSVTGLKPATKYYYRAFLCRNLIYFNVRSFGKVKSFTTPAIEASVSAEVSNIKCQSATVSGKLTVASPGTFTKSATLYFSDTASTLDALKSSGFRKTLTLDSYGSYSNIFYYQNQNTRYYYCVVASVDGVETVSSIQSFITPELPAHVQVDLGLSVKWSSFNIGASSPEEWGRYFAWGDVVGQTRGGSKWSGDGFSVSPAYELDADNNLKPAYDAAHVLLGGSWRMPTEAELQELKDNCTCTWISNYNNTGTAGMIFTGKKSGFTDKSIFLPAAGYGRYQYVYDSRSAGHYYSSTFDGKDYACALFFSSDNIFISSVSRYLGLSIRPVYCSQ